MKTVSKIAVLGKFFHMFWKVSSFWCFPTKSSVQTEDSGAFGKVFANLAPKNGQKTGLFANLIFTSKFAIKKKTVFEKQIFYVLSKNPENRVFGGVEGHGLQLSGENLVSFSASFFYQR